jgi:hypothetical protein
MLRALRMDDWTRSTVMADVAEDLRALMAAYEQAAAE